MEKRQIAQSLTLFTELRINEGGIGEGVELYISVFFHEFQDVGFSYQRLTAGKHVEVNT